jgi:transcriptional antiterminator RfaH
MYGSRRVSSYSPLFTGYVFMHGGEEHRIRALATNRLSRVLVVPDGERLWRDLSHIQKLIVSGAPLTVESRLAPGTRVRVRRGAMEGIEGTIISRRGQTRLLVHVDFLQQGASVEIDDLWVEPI